MYLLGRPFNLDTDCAALKSSLKKKEINARVACWALELEEYEYGVEHRKGEKMQHADALSRALVAGQTAARIEAMQQRDEKIKSLIEKTTEHPSTEYVVERGVLYRRQDDQRLLVVPEGIAHGINPGNPQQGSLRCPKNEERVHQAVLRGRL